jgi:glycosyltransferase involved in cell wall biosynthesis
MHRASSAAVAGWLRPGRRRGQRGAAGAGAGGGGPATNGRGAAANGVGAAAGPAPRGSGPALAAARSGLLVAFACMAVGVVLLFQNPQAYRGSPIELAVRRAAAVAAEFSLGGGGGGGGGSSGRGASAGPDLPLPPLLQFKREQEGQGLLGERRRSEQEARLLAQRAAAAAGKERRDPSPPPPPPRTTATTAATATTTPKQPKQPPTTPHNQTPSRSKLRHAIWWFGPIFSASGYGTEAIDFLLALARDGGLLPPSPPSPSSSSSSSTLAAAGPLRASHHGDNERPDVVAALTPEDRADLLRMAEAPALPTAPLRPSIVICHSFATNIAGASAEWARWRAKVEQTAKERNIPTGLPPGEPCPPDPRKWAYDFVVARTMYETHVPPPGPFVRKCNSVNEVWVPSAWGVEAFAAGGVDRGKLRAVPEGVNTSFFDPERDGGVAAMDLAARGRLVFGRPREERAAERGANNTRPFVFLSSFKWEPRKGWDVLLNAYLTEFLDGGGGGAGGGGGGAGDGSSSKNSAANVELHILTRPYAGNGDFAGQMRAWADAQLVPLVPGREAEAEGGEAGAKAAGGEAGATTATTATPAATASTATPTTATTKAQLPAAATAMAGEGAGGGGATTDDDADADDPSQQPKPPPAAATTTTTKTKLPVPQAYRRFPAVYIHTQHIADLAALYKSADAFVLPSRGEGWGRPHVEAMSMGLPVLATNWSGPVEFLDETVGYPIAIEGLEPADSGGVLKWARPSVSALRRLLRRVVERPEEAKALGLKARKRMVERYSPPVIARLLEAEFRRIEEAMP